MNREAIQRSTEEFEQAQYSTDSIDLSEAGRALAADAAKDESRADEARKAESARQAKVQELRKAYLEGRLNTPERVERAAQRILKPD